MTQGFVSEIYPTVQGEGPFAGERQMFVRLAGCPLRCRYCDTPESLTAKGHPSVSADRLTADLLDGTRNAEIETVTFTGGEPLAQTPFLCAVLPRLKEANLRIYLETAGVHPDLLRRVVAWCDVVAMDLKMPSATGRAHWEEHEAFLAIAGEKAFVKVVCDDKTEDAEFRRAVEIAAVVPSPPRFVIQPATPQPSGVGPPSADVVDRFAAIARSRLPHVLVREQQHPAWGVR